MYFASVTYKENDLKFEIRKDFVSDIRIKYLYKKNDMIVFRRILIYIFFCSFFLFCSINKINAVVSYTDSLENLLKQTTDKKAELEILNTLAKEYSFSSFEKGLDYGKKALELAKKLKDKEQEITALLNIGEVYSTNKNFSEADEYFSKAYNQSLKFELKKSVATSMNSIGLNYYNQKKYDEALKIFKECRLYSKTNKIKIEEGNALYCIAVAYKKKNDYKESESFFKQALSVFEELKDNNGLAKTYNTLGILNYELDQYDKAIECYQNALKFRLKSGEKRSSAIIYNNIGNIYIRWGKYEMALNNLQNSLKIFEELNLPSGIGSCLNNIGLIYENMVRGEDYNQNIGNYNKALDNYQKAIKIWETLDNKLEIANSYNNIGNIYLRTNQDKFKTQYGEYWEDSLTDKERKSYSVPNEYHRKALSLRENLGNKASTALSLYNIGKIYSITKEYNTALAYLGKASRLFQEQGVEFADVYSGIGKIYSKQGNHTKALEFLEKALNISIKNKTMASTSGTYLAISNVYTALGDYKKSLEMYKQYVQIQDSLVNENTTKQFALLQTQFETEKKEKEIELLNKDAKLKDAKLVQTFIFFTGGLILVLVITVFQIRQNRERKKTNIQLEAKNHLITEQKQEITDSIQYASRIQKAVMTVETQLKQLLPNSFIYFRPRDIVSGDFFWVNEKNNKIIVVAADCTGHGVPGAFMSMLGMSMFKNIVAETDELHSDSILNELRIRIIDSLHQTGKEGENKDGMDLALYIIDYETNSLEFSGANNPLYLVRAGELVETKADRMPIGIHEKLNEPFTRHVIPIQKGDMLYTFSDGYHDQFGGPADKKFMSGNLKKLFIKIYSESVEKQHDILHDTITDWMKNTIQIDDILVIGVRV